MILRDAVQPVGIMGIDSDVPELSDLQVTRPLYPLLRIERVSIQVAVGSHDGCAKGEHDVDPVVVDRLG